MLAKTVFKNYAYYYDLLYQKKDYKREAEYICRLIRKYSQDAKNILDLGCGTGSHDVFMAEKGYKILGIDFSPEMINLGIEKLDKKYSDNITLKIGDIRNLDLKKKYDVVTLLFNVIGYQVDNADLNATLQTASRHLKNDGIFIFDFWYGPAVLLDRPKNKIKKVEDENNLVIRSTTSKLHLISNHVDIKFKMTVKNKIDGKMRHFSETHSVRYMFIPEIQNMLEDNGFELVSFSEWMSSKKPSTESWYACIVAKKI